MKKHKAIEATVERARHYGAIARDALAIFADTRAAQGACRCRFVLRQSRALIGRACAGR